MIMYIFSNQKTSTHQKFVHILDMCVEEHVCAFSYVQRKRIDCVVASDKYHKFFALQLFFESDLPNYICCQLQIDIQCNPK